MNNSSNFQVFAVNTIANYDQTIIPYLSSPVGSVFEKLLGSDEWQVVTDFVIPE